MEPVGAGPVGYRRLQMDPLQRCLWTHHSDFIGTREASFSKGAGFWSGVKMYWESSLERRFSHWGGEMRPLVVV